MREFIILGIAILIVVLAPSSGYFFGAQAQNVRLIESGLSESENASENFPGSAFYFIEQNEAIPSKNPSFDENIDAELPGLNGEDRITVGDLDGEGEIQTTQNPQKFPSQSGVKPFVIRPSSAGYLRALKCLTDAIYYEGATEPEMGQRAIAQVIINRLRHPTYPTSVCGVIYQGSERRTGCQFSYSCDGSMRRNPNKFYWNRARRVASSALSGSVFAPVGTATHYHTTEVYPYWAPSLDFIGTVGAHRFYRWKGSAGRPSAFFKRYAGREPFPGPKARAYTPPKKVLNPVELQKQYEREYRAASLKAEQEALAARLEAQKAASQVDPLASIRPVPVKQFAAPQYSQEAKKAGGESQYRGENLPNSSNIKSEYSKSGSWKKQPS